jgi:hypothetical protein
MKSALEFVPQHGFGLLITGPPKSGKTVLACQFERPWIADCDNNLAGPFRLLSSSMPEQFRTIKYADINKFDNGEVVPDAARWTRLVTEASEAVKDPTVRTIVFDGLSTISTYLIDHIVSAKPTGRAEGMTISDWVPFRNMLSKLVMQSRACKKLIVMTAHDENNKDELRGTMIVTVNIPSKLAGTLGGFFSDVWHCEHEEIGGEVKYKIRAMPSTQCPSLGNSLGLPKEFTFTWSGFSKFLEQYGTAHCKPISQSTAN